MTDLLVKNCFLLQKKDPQDILIKGGIIKVEFGLAKGK